MKIYDDVELNTEIDELSDCGIHRGCQGIVVGIEQDLCLVLFLNKFNRGDYAFARVHSDFLDIWDGASGMFIDDIKVFIETHDPAQKTAFDILKLKEYDLVELAVEKDEYARNGVHKGMKGVILQEVAIKGKWEVTFSNDEGEDISTLIIPEKHLKKIG